MPTFPSNTNNKPKNLGKPNPPITLRRNAGRTPGHRARRNPLRRAMRRAMRNPPRRGWRKGARAPGRDTGHTTRHHPEPTPTSTNTPTTAHPEKRARKAPGNGRKGRGALPGGRDRGRRGHSRHPPSFPYNPRNLNTAVSRSKTLSGLVTTQKTTNPAPLSANAPQHRFSGTFSTVVTVTVSTRPTSRPRRLYEHSVLSVRETSKNPFPTPFLLDISVTSIKLWNNYSCSHLNYNKIAHTLQAFYAITAGQTHNQGTPRTPTTPPTLPISATRDTNRGGEGGRGEGPQRWGRQKPQKINPKPLDTSLN